MTGLRVPVRVGRVKIFKVHFTRETVEVLPYAIRKLENREAPGLVNLSMGRAMGDRMFTINADQVCFWEKVEVPVIQAGDVEADEDGEEVMVWDIAGYEVANRFQFHQTNHRADLDPQRDDCPHCSVVITHRDSDRIPFEWQMSLWPERKDKTDGSRG